MSSVCKTVFSAIALVFIAVPLVVCGGFIAMFAVDMAVVGENAPQSRRMLDSSSESSGTDSPAESPETAEFEPDSAKSERVQAMERHVAWVYAQLFIVERDLIPGATPENFPFEPEKITTRADDSIEVIASLETPRGENFAPFRCVLERVPPSENADDNDFRLVSFELR